MSSKANRKPEHNRTLALQPSCACTLPGRRNPIRFRRHFSIFDNRKILHLVVQADYRLVAFGYVLEGTAKIRIDIGKRNKQADRMKVVGKKTLQSPAIIFRQFRNNLEQGAMMALYMTTNPSI